MVKSAGPAYTRSRAGCQTCRIRRVKCDQAKPHCRRCKSTGRNCDGYSTSTFIAYHGGRRSEASQYPLSTVRQYMFLENAVEGRAFSYFMERAAPILAGALDAKCWAVLLPQLAANNRPSVKYSLLAISHFFENPCGEIDGKGKPVFYPTGSRHVQGMSWYAKALEANRADQQQSLTDILLTCTLFSSLEMQQCNYDAGFRVMRMVYLLLAPMLTASGHQLDQSACEVLSIIMPMALRSSGLLFSSQNHVISIDLSNGERHDIQTALFGVMLRTYAGLKDTHVACGSNRNAIASFEASHKRQRQRLSLIEKTFHGQLLCQEETLPHIQVLLEYCQICWYWLDLISDFIASWQDSRQSFLSLILSHIKRLKANARDLYPLASPTTYFQEMVIEPPAYIVAVFDPDPTVRKEAFALLHEQASLNSKPQIHAIILPVDVPLTRTNEPPFQNMMKFVPAGPGPKFEDREGFVINVEVSASDWVAS